MIFRRISRNRSAVVGEANLERPPALPRVDWLERDVVASL